LNLKAPPSCGGIGELQTFTQSWATGQIAKNPTECARTFRVTTGGFGYRALSATQMIATGSMQLLQNGSIMMAAIVLTHHCWRNPGRMETDSETSWLQEALLWTP